MKIINNIICTLLKLRIVREDFIVCSLSLPLLFVRIRERGARQNRCLRRWCNCHNTFWGEYSSKKVWPMDSRLQKFWAFLALGRRTIRRALHTTSWMECAERTVYHEHRGGDFQKGGATHHKGWPCGISMVRHSERAAPAARFHFSGKVPLSCCAYTNQLYHFFIFWFAFWPSISIMHPLNHGGVAQW